MRGVAKYYRWLLIAVFAAWWCVGALWFINQYSLGVSEANGAQIVQGMTRAQVEAILGPPSLVPTDGGRVIWMTSTVAGCRLVTIFVAYDDDRVSNATVSACWRAPSWW